MEGVLAEAGGVCRVGDPTSVVGDVGAAYGEERVPFSQRVSSGVKSAAWAVLNNAPETSATREMKRYSTADTLGLKASSDAGRAA